MVARIVPIKDVRTFILAAEMLAQIVPDVEAIIIGPEDEDQDYAAECRSLVRQGRLERVVTFEGRVPDIMDYYPRADVFALTSISEAQPLALLEAGAAGRPIATTDVGSCREILAGGPPRRVGAGRFRRPSWRSARFCGSCRQTAAEPVAVRADGRGDARSASGGSTIRRAFGASMRISMRNISAARQARIKSKGFEAWPGSGSRWKEWRAAAV